MTYLLHQLLTESASKYPDKEAIVYKDQVISYAGLEKESSQLAALLSGGQAERGRRIGIYLNRSISSLAGAFGVLKAGACYVPIDPLSPPNRLRYIVEKCQIETLIVSADKLATIRQIFPQGAPLLNIVVMDGPCAGSAALGSAQLLDWQALRGCTEVAHPCANSIDADLAYILFTSGSTGSPKGVMLTHLNALTFINAAGDFYGISSEDRVSNICPLHFDMSVFDIFVTIRAGATVVVIPDTITAFPVKLAETIAQNRISVWNSVPSALCLLSAYKNLPNHDLSSLRLILFAGELFPLKYLRQLRQTLPGARFCNMYGQTEANSSTYYPVEQLPEDDGASLPIGRALPNFEVFALDDAGARIGAPGQEGELYVRGATVALGYWGEPEKTAQAFVANPLSPDLGETVYRTGDLVQLDAEGNFRFLGRKDHMIKSRGYRIEIGELETVLCGHPDIKNAVVIPIPDELIGNRLSVLVVPCTPDKLGKEEVRLYCCQHLPKYMVPDIIDFRDFLPTTSSGKVDRQRLSSIGLSADHLKA